MQDTQMHVRHLTIQFDTPLLIFLIIPFFKPGCLYYIAPTVSTIFDFWLIVAVGIIGVIYLLRGKMSKMMLVIILFELSFVFTTVINNGSMWVCIKTCVEPIALCMLVELCISQCVKKLINTLVYVLGIEVVIDGITILAYPQGMYATYGFYPHWENWFLGFRNEHGLYILPLLCFFWIYATYKNLPRFARLSGIILLSLPIYLSWSATSVMGVSAFLILYLFSELHLLTKFLEIKKYILIIVAAFFSLVLFRLQDVFAPLIVGILKRSLTFTGRTFVWDKTIAFIKMHPFLGGGINTLEVDARIINAPHAHNYFLQILYQSGILGMTFFVVIVVLMVKHMQHAKDRKYSFIISSTLFSFLVLLLAESYGRNMAFFFGIITMAYHINKLTAGLSEAGEQTDDPLTETLKCGES